MGWGIGLVAEYQLMGRHNYLPGTLGYQVVDNNLQEAGRKGKRNPAQVEAAVLVWAGGKTLPTAMLAL